eukprot:CAMPEP_0198147490 /NCGR_PEP_ID=MMETSP1443-20131203/36065_1 /TAXON_ID=186043 /ORGANISM="Entomoneis sp., Strain CCMP2396" /LENGTH=230 /DNA_ID=CAMNT_0043811855 /DNA_START=51 /DNA_END=743 /DNA_ORIENTATION=-
MKYRGGAWGLLEHMYVNGDFPFKFGTYMGCDAMGNRYYENRIDYPWGQQRWIEPVDINNFDATQIAPEWHGWMHHQNDATPLLEEEYIQEKLKHVEYGEISHNPFKHNIGHQEPYFLFHGMHNQSQIRSRGYNIGNPMVGLPPGAPDAYYTQPGSPYNKASHREFPMIGALDEDGGRAFKSEKWRQRLLTPAQLEAEKQEALTMVAPDIETAKPMSPREIAMAARGGNRR